MVKNNVFHQPHSVAQMTFRIGFLDAHYHLSSFWTKLTEIGGTPMMWSVTGQVTTKMIKKQPQIDEKWMEIEMAGKTQK